MPSTSRGLPYPAESDTPDGPAQIRALAAALDLFASAMQGTHASRPSAASHPFTVYYETDTHVWFYSDGSAWQSNLPPALSVVTSMLADLNVTTGKLANAAVTSQKLKPTAGVVTQTSNVVATGTFQDLTGATTGSFTPAVASLAIVVGVFDYAYTLNVSGDNAIGIGGLNVDGAVQTRQPSFGSNEGGTLPMGLFIQGVGLWLVSLSAAAHTLKLQGKATLAGAGSGTFQKSQLFYLLVAS